MTDSKSLVSVIIPVYNCDRYLAEAIKSVLAQTYHPLEIIVVNDGSTDRSADVVKGFADQVRYFYQHNSGPGAARNQGANLAHGTFFAFLDADDFWLEDKLTLQMAAFDGDPELDMLFGQVRQFHSPELGVHLKAEVGQNKEIMAGYFAGTILVKRESFFQVGPFETNWQVGEFIDWYSRAMEKGLKSIMLTEVVIKRRIHMNNMGIRERQSQTDYLKILKAALDRRRGKV